jgi:hypothetical protein
MRNNAGGGNSLIVEQPKAPAATVSLRRKWLDDWRGMEGGILEEEV